MPIPMTVRCALTVAKAIERANPHFDNSEHDDYIMGLEHALECIEHMTKLLKYIRSKLPSYEPELYAMITNQLSKGCDIE